MGNKKHTQGTPCPYPGSSDHEAMVLLEHEEPDALFVLMNNVLAKVEVKVKTKN